MKLVIVVDHDSDMYAVIIHALREQGYIQGDAEMVYEIGTQIAGDLSDIEVWYEETDN